MKIIRTLNSESSRKQYEKLDETSVDNLHWGQRKLLMSEIEFLTKYYESYDNDKKKYLLYIGSSRGFHINYLMKMFPDIHYILYDKRTTYVKPKENVEIHKMYFNDEIAKQYTNMNLFLISDIRNLDVRQIKEQKNMKKLDALVVEDMNIQKHWCEIVKPKQALLKFRLPWFIPSTKYYDGIVYFQIWSGNFSAETRMVPNFEKTKDWDNRKYEEQMFYYNTVTRRQEIKNPTFKCLGNYHDSQSEGFILSEYIKKFEDSKDIEKEVCDLSISITLYLSKFIPKLRVGNKYIKHVEDIHENKDKPVKLKIM